MSYLSTHAAQEQKQNILIKVLTAMNVSLTQETIPYRVLTEGGIRTHAVLPTSNSRKLQRMLQVYLKLAP